MLLDSKGNERLLAQAIKRKTSCTVLRLGMKTGTNSKSALQKMFASEYDGKCMLKMTGREEMCKSLGD